MEPSRVLPSDPYVQSIPHWAEAPTGGASCSSLKARSEPDVFALPPVANCDHRLVLDLYPVIPLDPLMAFLEAEARKGQEDRRRAAGSAEARGRSLPSAQAQDHRTIDPGHGARIERDRPPRNLQEERDARDRAQRSSRRARIDERNIRRDAHARRRLLRAAAKRDTKARRCAR